ncbi:MAG TPA: hypothetical protein VIW02_05345, partial [Gammaproteobacteria bacterium]
MRAAVAGLLLLSAGGHALAASDVAPSEYAEPMPLASRSLLLDADRAGERIVAVGERGHLLVSGDEGQSWSQRRVPTVAMLTAVHFHDER